MSNLTEDDVRQLVRLRMKQHAKRKGSTGLTAWCRANSVAKAHASEFMRGMRRPCNDLLSALGLRIGYAFEEGEVGHDRAAIAAMQGNDE